MEVAPNIDPPAAVLVTDPKRPVTAAVVGLVAASAVVPKIEVGFEASVVTAPNAELAPKIDVVSDLGVENELLPNMLVEGAAVEAAGVDGEQMLNDPKRLDVASVVVVEEAAVVTVGAEDAGVGEGETVAFNEKADDVVAAVVVVVTVVEDVNAGVVAAVVTVEDTGAAVVLEDTAPKTDFGALVVTSDLMDKSVGLVAAPKLKEPVPPKANPELIVVVVGGLTDPNKVEVVEVVAAGVAELTSVTTTTVESAIDVATESASPFSELLLEGIGVVAAGLIEPKRPVPAAIVAVEFPNILGVVAALAAAPNGLCVLGTSTAVVSTFPGRFFDAVSVPSSAAPVFPKLGKGSFFGSCLGFSSFFTSGSFSLTKFKAGAAGWGTPKAVLPVAPAPNANDGLLLVAAPKVSTGLLGSALPLVALSALGMAWIVVLPKPNIIGFCAGSWFSLSFEEVIEVA